MPLQQLPPVLWLLAIACALAVALLGAWEALRIPREPAARRTPERVAAGVGAVLLVAVALLVAPEAPKGQLTALGVVVGAILSGLIDLGPRGWADQGDPRRLTFMRAGVALLALAIADRLVGDPVLLSYAACGGLLGWAAVVMPRVLADPFNGERSASGLGLGAAFALVALWGDRALDAGSLGSAWGLVAAGVILLAAQAATWLPAVWASVAAAVAGAGVVIPLGAWGVALSPAYLWPLGLGLGLSALLGTTLALSERAGGRGPLSTLGHLLIAGGALLLANRLYGMYGAALVGVAIAPTLAAGGRALAFGGGLAAAFAGRAALQIFLDRTYLHATGVDLTRTYAALGWVAALLLSGVILQARRQFQPGGALRGLFAIALLVLPLPIGYLVHVDPVATYGFGLVAALFAWGLRPTDDEGHMPHAALLVPMLASAVSMALVVAPWLLKVMNAPRSERIGYLLVLSLVAVGYGVALVWRREPAQAA